ncbi:MAG: hypothetical protein SPI30_04640 [Prevotella sp.]|nr:hypothetical protein [Prevotella sp.]
MSSSLSAAFVKNVACYAEEERQRRCRQSTEIIIFSGKCSVGGLMTDWG